MHAQLQNLPAHENVEDVMEYANIVSTPSFLPETAIDIGCGKKDKNPRLHLMIELGDFGRN